jgi:hypothetical protein
LAGVALPREGDDLAAAREAALDATARAGLSELVEDAGERARTWVGQAYAAGQYQPTMFGLNWGRSSGRLEDRFAVESAVEDAGIAAAVDGLVSVDLVDILRERFVLLATMHPAGDTPQPDVRRRSVRILAAGLLTVFAVTFGLGALQFGFLAAAIPIAMVVAIVYLASRAGSRS